MWELFVHTSTKDFLLILINSQKTESYSVFESNLVKKSEYIHKAFENVLNQAKIESSEIKNYYSTFGPGSFMGIRVGLLFSIGLAKLNQKKLFVATSFVCFSFEDLNKSFYIHGGGQSYFQGKYIDNSWHLKTLENKVNLEPSKFDYEEIIKNWNYFKLKFVEENDPEPYYGKELEIR